MMNFNIKPKTNKQKEKSHFKKISILFFKFLTFYTTAKIYIKAKAIQQADPIKNDLTATRSLLTSSLYFSFQTQNVAIKYHNINPQKTK